MVEIREIMKLISNILLFATLATGTLMAAEVVVTPRIKGLETNAEYMQLLNKEYVVLQHQDSLTQRVAEVRSMFRTAPERRAELGSEILQLENEIFSARNEAGSISSKINLIEQEYIITNLAGEEDDAPQTADSTESAHASNTSANLVLNDYFRLRLPAADYKALVDAQQKEKETYSYFAMYQAHHKAIDGLREQYQAVDNAFAADSLYSIIKAIRSDMDRVSDSLGASWSYIFENKSYAYNYLLDRANEMESLSSFEKRTQQAREKQAEMTANGTVPNIANYITQKNIVFEYENGFAKRLRLSNALDSLGKAEAAFKSGDHLLYITEIPERLFLDYANIEFKHPAAYNQANPIPALTIYPKGIIYRVLIGAYPRLQAVGIFRGTYPLGYSKEGNQHLYYAGGYRTLEEAEKGLKDLKAVGFRNAKVVVWNYGEYTELNGTPDKNGTQYRVAVGNAGNSLPEAAREAIAATAPDKEISKAGDDFYVGPFPTPLEAERTAEKIRFAGEDLIVKIVEIN